MADREHLRRHVAGIGRVGTHATMSLGRMVAASALVAGVFVMGTMQLSAANAVRPHGFKIARTPNGGAAENYLSEVACPTSSFCMSVGGFSVVTTTNDHSLILRSNGKAWTLSSSPNVGMSDDLNAVSCTSPTFCMSAGSWYDGSNEHVLMLRWTGKAWVRVATPNIGQWGIANSVSCTSPTFCMAVGYSRTGPSTYMSFAERWNGKRWSIVTPSQAGLSMSNLQAVKCLSATWCDGVGYGSAAGPNLALAEHWNGHAWARYPMPTITSDAYLQRLTCTSASFCVAVGSTDASVYRTLIERWNGSAWKIAPSPNVGNFDNLLYGVSCWSPTLCVASGHSTVSNVNRALVERWNGAGWAVETIPLPSAGRSSLNGGSTVPGSAEMFLIAGYATLAHEQTLVLAGH